MRIRRKKGRKEERREGARGEELKGEEEGRREVEGWKKGGSDQRRTALKVL